jgi:hypothetical protein
MELAAIFHIRLQYMIREWGALSVPVHQGWEQCFNLGYSVYDLGMENLKSPRSMGLAVIF